MYRVHPCSLVSQQTALITKVSGRGSIKILDPFYSGSCLHWGLVVVTFACCRGGRETNNNALGEETKDQEKGFFLPTIFLARNGEGSEFPPFVFAQQVSAGVRRFFFYSPWTIIIGPVMF